MVVFVLLFTVISWLKRRRSVNERLRENGLGPSGFEPRECE
jgi:hypothetical protein